MKLLSINTKNFVALELKKFNNEINSFFKYSHCSKFGIRWSSPEKSHWNGRVKKFQSSTFDTKARRKLVEDQDTILELSGRIQALQNEINCMSDSTEFQDAESIRSGNSHVTSQPMLFPKHPILEGLLRPSFVSPRRKEGRQIFGTHMVHRETFLQSTGFLYSSLSSRIESMEFVNWGAAPFIHSGKEWKARTRSRSEMPAWTVSQKFSHLQWRRLFKELMGADQQRLQISDLPVWQDPYASNLRLLEDKIQGLRYVLVHNFLRKRCNGSKKWSWLIQWMVEDLRHRYGVFQCRILK